MQVILLCSGDFLSKLADVHARADDLEAQNYCGNRVITPDQIGTPAADRLLERGRLMKQVWKHLERAERLSGCGNIARAEWHLNRAARWPVQSVGNESAVDFVTVGSKSWWSGGVRLCRLDMAVYHVGFHAPFSVSPDEKWPELVFGVAAATFASRRAISGGFCPQTLLPLP